MKTMKMYGVEIEYNSYSAKTVEKYWKLGEACEKREDLDQYMNLHPQLYYFACLGFKNKDRYEEYQINTFEVKEYYRFGEPSFDFDMGEYFRSYNRMDDKMEDGVSVVSGEWLHSLKSVFFNTNRPVYKIKGIQIGWGGDSEPVIYPVEFAEKTDLTYDELMEKIA